MTPQTVAGLLTIAAGVALIVVSRILIRRIDRLVELGKATQLTRLGERMVTPELIGCQLLLMVPIGVGLIVVGLWVTVASFW